MNLNQVFSCALRRIRNHWADDGEGLLYRLLKFVEICLPVTIKFVYFFTNKTCKKKAYERENKSSDSGELEKAGIK